MDLSSVLMLLIVCQTNAFPCPEQCECFGDTMSCVEHIPQNPPRKVTKVYLNVIDAELLSAKFDRGLWDNVTFLDIFVSKGNTIYNDSFSGLDNLDHIGIHGPNISELQASVFFNLLQVKILDLSENLFLTLTPILTALNASDSCVLPSLENLTLARLSSGWTDPVNLDYSAYAIMANNRSIKYIDLSGVNIGYLNFAFPHQLCKSLQHVKFQRTTFGLARNFYNIQPCSSLHTFDFTGAIVPNLLKQKRLESFRFTCSPTAWFTPIKYLYFSSVLLTPKPLYVDTFNFNISACDFNLIKLVSNQNKLQWLNLTVEFPKSMRKSFVELDLSENLIEYYSPKALNQLEALEIFRLSHNSLHVMQKDYSSDFEILFQSLRKLRKLELAFNELTNIPKKIFSENKVIEFIDLSNNRLTDITFELQGLNKMTYLNISRNHIKVLNDFAMKQLDYPNTETMIITQYAKSDTKLQRKRIAFLVDLSWNTFHCTCDKNSIDFLKWILNTRTVTINNTEGYTCDLEGKTVNLLQSALSETEKFCEYQQFIRTIKIAGPLILVVCIAIIASAILLRKQYIKRRRINDIIKQIQLKQFQKKFLVFLSFASDEDDFVRDKVLNQLEQSLSKIVDKPGTYVSYGDRDFHLGRYVHEEVNRVVEEAAVVIFVVSNAFCRKEWCQMEVNEASALRKPIILLMREHVYIKDMPKCLRNIFKRYVHASWVNDENGGHIEPNWPAVCKAILDLASRKMEYGLGVDNRI